MILVTGGAGYIGSHTNRILNDHDLDTIVFDNLSTGHKKYVKWGEFVLGDLTCRSHLELCFDNYEIDSVIHFAASAYVGESIVDPEKYYINNVYGTINLLNVMRKFGIKRIVFSSSCATYGTPDTLPITEETNQNPINPYGRSKLMIEQILKDYDHAYGIKHINLRYFNAAGADAAYGIGEDHLPETHLIPLAIEVAMGTEASLKVFGNDYPTVDGTCIRDYVHVNDLARAHYLALKYLDRTKKSNSFNLANSRGYSIKEIINVTEKISGRKINFSEVSRRIGDPPTLVGSYKKINNFMGWEPVYKKLDDIILSAWIWHQQKSHN
jgi:UDP-glucose 4-epimerase